MITRFTRWLVFGLVAVGLFTRGSSQARALDDPIQLKSGPISGATVESNINIRVYKGIPYASPPVDALRWRPPQAVSPWQGVRACEQFSPTALQVRTPVNQIGASSPASEDCLYLNVWTGAKTANDKLPVMVWIHGGGWANGSGSSLGYNGEAFARKGVLLVSINYRLGPLGFLAHPLLSAESERGVSGNYAILDQIAALGWVQDNIASFGGNPENVTIFGESAGGSSVYVLVATPLTKGLFQKAIAESAWVSDSNFAHLKQRTAKSDSAEVIGQRAIAAALGKDRTDVLAAMRDLPAEKAIKLALPAAASVDGWLLPQFPREIYRDGSQNHVALIAGTNNGEGVTMVAANKTYNSMEEYRQDRVKDLGSSTDDILQHYQVNSVDDIRQAQIDLISDFWYHRPARDMARGMASVQSRAFMYHFTRNAVEPSAQALHAAEIPYVFMRVPEAMKRLNRDTVDPIDLKLSETINSYWVQFAKVGDPNVDGQPTWPAYDTQSEQYLVLGEPIKIGSSLRKDSLDALDRAIDQRDREFAGAAK
ncbi:MAG: carboxylesterase family protein [Pirellulaceae bacterium]|nr:carboxylesterase family protein [Pirellulaceae bacterium]